LIATDATAHAVSLPCSLAALAIPPRAAMTCSPYRIGIRTVFYRPSRMTDAKSTLRAKTSCVAPTRTECPLTPSMASAGSSRYRATALNARDTASGLNRPPYPALAHFIVRDGSAPDKTPEHCPLFYSGDLKPCFEIADAVTRKVGNVPFPRLVSLRASDQEPSRPIIHEFRILDIDRDQFASPRYGVVRDAQHGALADCGKIHAGRTQKCLYAPAESLRMALSDISLWAPHRAARLLGNDLPSDGGTPDSAELS